MIFYEELTTQVERWSKIKRLGSEKNTVSYIFFLLESVKGSFDLLSTDLIFHYCSSAIAAHHEL